MLIRGQEEAPNNASLPFTSIVEGNLLRVSNKTLVCSAVVAFELRRARCEATKGGHDRALKEARE